VKIKTPTAAGPSPAAPGGFAPDPDLKKENTKQFGRWERIARPLQIWLAETALVHLRHLRLP
jgi:hypothetical protein